MYTKCILKCLSEPMREQSERRTAKQKAPLKRGRLYVRRTAGLDERRQAMLKLDSALSIE
ncbi:hypothetical protein BACT_1133 [Bifidobacterium actinocoloniiforme DSM 22766]|uniref:Uncharacterized protein n=1 Tax=Bifidobacterium actinocoloniiforme DSM 22766 TaxID=1437605 RepID=A0A086Z1M9_9BIFI|nr:hypothetical protein BACT_1133 [Bifidobacterium actinocoloniiforme DSM 22766]